MIHGFRRQPRHALTRSRHGPIRIARHIAGCSPATRLRNLNVIQIKPILGRILRFELNLGLRRTARDFHRLQGQRGRRSDVTPHLRKGGAIRCVQDLHLRRIRPVKPQIKRQGRRTAIGREVHRWRRQDALAGSRSQLRRPRVFENFGAGPARRLHVGVQRAGTIRTAGCRDESHEIFRQVRQRRPAADPGKCRIGADIQAVACGIGHLTPCRGEIC